MRKLLVAFVGLLAFAAHPVKAQTYIVQTCGTWTGATLNLGPSSYGLTMDVTGKLCTNSSGGGGGTVANPNIVGYSNGGVATVNLGGAFGPYVDESTSSQLHTDLTAPLALDTNGGIGPIEVLQTSPSGGSLTAADIASTTTTATSQGGQAIVTGVPTAGSTITFTFPNAEGAASFNITGMTGLVTGGSILSECSPNNASWALCNINLPNQASTTSITGNVIGGRVNVTGSKYWRLRNTGTLTGTGTVTAQLTPVDSTDFSADSANNVQGITGMSLIPGTPLVWSPSTANNTTFQIANKSGAAGAIITFTSSACTGPAGQVQAQVSQDGTNFTSIAPSQLRNLNGSQATNPYVMTNNTVTNQILDFRGAQIFQLLLSPAITGTGACTLTITGQLVGNAGAPVPVGMGTTSNTSVPQYAQYSAATLMSQYPGQMGGGPNPLVVKATGSTSAVTATLGNAANTTTFICGFDVTATGGSATVGPITVTGLLGGTWTYQVGVNPLSLPNGSKEFTPCLPASAANTGISVVTTANGTATAVDVNVHGYENPQ